MSKETLKAKILANIAGQGSMVDISGQLSAILDEIVDLIPEGGTQETIVVVGQINDAHTEFKPNEGEPRVQEMRDAFFAGARIFLSFDSRLCQVVSVDNEETAEPVLWCLSPYGGDSVQITW